MSIDRQISDIIFIHGIYDKEKNKYGKRRESQTFFFNGKYYWADLNTFLDMETECMIFKSDKRGKVTNWNEVYCRRNIDVTRENLLKCIEEFKREMEENELNRYAEMTLVASYLRTAYNKVASMYLHEFLTDDVGEKIQKCLVAMEDAAMLLCNEKLEILKEVKVKKETEEYGNG